MFNYVFIFNSNDLILKFFTVLPLTFSHSGQSPAWPAAAEYAHCLLAYLLWYRGLVGTHSHMIPSICDRLSCSVSSLVSSLSTLHLTQSHPDCGLICAVHSSMPDKSMCQHLFLCCQFFMVFDDISPIVRPTCVVRWDPSPSPSPSLRPAGHKHQTVSDQFWGACLPIWLNRTWTLRGELCRWQDAFFSLFFSLPLAWAF